MNTILMAAARGARIQTRYTDTLHTDWKTVSGVVFDPSVVSIPHEQRIHPDDEHLRFGPVSTALREMAETGKVPYTSAGLMAQVTFDYERTYPYVFPSEWHERTLFLLILSEALAEIGL